MTLHDVNVIDPERYVAGVPHDQFAFLRAHAPVFWHHEANGSGFWAVTKYADVLAVSKDPATFCSGRGTNIFDVPEEDRGAITSMMVNMDPPRHTKHRRLVSRGFTPRMVAALEAHIRELAKGIVDRIAPRGECDFVREVAAELPLQVIAELMGIPPEDRHLVFDWSNRLIGFDDPEFQTSYEDGKVAAAEMWMYAHRLAELRRGSSRDDLVSVLMRAELDGEKLSEEEFDGFFLLLAVAGNETTRNLISGGMLALIEHPEERTRLLASPGLLPSAVEEMLRWVTPVMHFRRTATRDAEIGGQRISAGDKVVMFYASANRDEAVFYRPNRFDAARTPNEHLAFGVGEHFCLGSNLARLEIRVLFEELLGRLPDIGLAAPARRLRSNFINGIKEMRVRFTPEADRGRAAA